MNVIDEKYLQSLKSAFNFAEKKSFCQIATVEKTIDGCLPKSRTVLLYLLEERNAFRLTCSTQTHKWMELKATPKVTGLYLDTETYTQYRFEADATLIDNTTEDEKALYESSWAAIRPDLRHVLWQEYLDDPNASYNIDEIFPHHGTVLLKPYYWDIFKLGLEDFADSRRTQMVLKSAQWEIHDNGPRICSLDIKR
ncbi:MAG: hypothetical protein COV52_05095 [Gammaproteobacteria bacterium CG11_big_fil_rev_8_21_14_0_20_46_22]|nr:MAG: hypothetical protein COW05_10160 [Gammaproteobacteria bacterium CG12_big_fil_rev_8_21_14_0_65_46_12]PIR11172.1 MAG: hypothetical protein COV52_05095 [Gammaproteobacteria bacterium CG11_big_fil_rev_8_21_14_0_20_46_22]